MEQEPILFTVAFYLIQYLICYILMDKLIYVVTEFKIYSQWEDWS